MRKALEASDMSFPINLATALRLSDARPLVVAAVTLACVVGDDVIWDGALPPEAPDLQLALVRFAAAARLAFVEIALAPVRRGTAVVQVEPQPRLEHFSEGARNRILDAVAALFVAGPDSSRIAA